VDRQPLPVKRRHHSIPPHFPVLRLCLQVRTFQFDLALPYIQHGCRSSAARTNSNSSEKQSLSHTAQVHLDLKTNRCCVTPSTSWHQKQRGRSNVAKLSLSYLPTPGCHVPVILKLTHGNLCIQALGFALQLKSPWRGHSLFARSGVRRGSSWVLFALPALSCTEGRQRHIILKSTKVVPRCKIAGPQ
jgi:hypothetical protein